LPPLLSHGFSLVWKGDEVAIKGRHDNAEMARENSVLKSQLQRRAKIGPAEKRKRLGLSPKLKVQAQDLLGLYDLDTRKAQAQLPCSPSHHQYQ
jgi:hypothetical protein